MSLVTRLHSTLHGAAMFLAGVAAALAALFVFQALTADAIEPSESTFIPLDAPCRLIDTRPAPYGIGPHDAFGPDETKTIAAHGSNGDCVLPTDAVAVSMNVTAVGATERTNVRFWAEGNVPNASSLNPAPGEPPTPNAVTTSLSSSGSFNVYNRFGTVDLIVDVNGYYRDLGRVDLEARLAEVETSLAEVEAGVADVWTDVSSLNTDLVALEGIVDGLSTGRLSDAEDAIAALEHVTESMSLELVDGYPVIRFTGVNVQVVSGAGSTSGSVNGVGNLLIGYHENIVDERTGSHNLVIGPWHSYTDHSGVVIGENNTVGGSYGVVLGGGGNTADANFAGVLGGIGNTASGWASVVAGASNSTTESSTTGGAVFGGEHNTASGEWAVVLGGDSHTASGTNSSVAGGYYNTASGQGASVFGGGTFRTWLYDGNVASGESSTVVGGVQNTTTAQYTSIVGGINNTVSSSVETIAGGDDITCSVDDILGSGALCGEGTINPAD